MTEKYLHKYRSIETEIEEYDASPLSPTSKLVYKQWKMDNNDETLIDGYYRQSNIFQTLPHDIRQIIVRYYLKKYSKGALTRKIIALKEQAYRKRQQRKEKAKNCLQGSFYIFASFMVVILALALIFGTDIAALVIISKNNCDLALHIDSVFTEFGVNQYLLVGSVIHIPCVLVLSTLFYISIYIKSDKLITCVVIAFGIVALFLVSWCVLGAVLYSDMIQNTTAQQQCSDIVISWIVLKLFLYIVVVPVFLYMIQEPVRIIMLPLICFIMLCLTCGYDIIGLIVSNTKACDHYNQNQLIHLGISNYLFIGCIVHIICVVIILGIPSIGAAASLEQCCDWRWYICSFVVTGLFFLCWCIVGCILYSEMSETNSNKMCMDILLTWIILKLIECIVLKPGLSLGWLKFLEY